MKRRKYGRGRQRTEQPPIDRSGLYQTRRRVLRTTAAAGTLSILGLPARAQAKRIKLGRKIEGWQGLAPAAIEGETNPTLELEVGKTYVVEWKNLDGAPHKFVIEDADGNHLVETETVETQGATQTVKFEAKRAMTEYYCEVHPQTMRGDISIGEAPSEVEEAVLEELPPNVRDDAKDVMEELPPEIRNSVRRLLAFLRQFLPQL